MSKLNFVLVHGGFHGGWCWRFVAEELRATGHAVTTPTQTGLGERQHLLRPGLTLETFTQDVVSHLECEELSDVILVGHSFGGLSISGAAERVPHLIRHLVYLDSLIIAPGQTPYGALPPDVVALRRRSCTDINGVSCFTPIPVEAFGIPADHPHAQWVQRRLTPHPESLYDSPLPIKNPVGNGLPRTYIACTAPQLSSVAASQAWARAEPGWDWIEMKACHDVMVTQPQELSRLLVRIANRPGAQ